MDRALNFEQASNSLKIKMLKKNFYLNLRQI